MKQTQSAATIKDVAARAGVSTATVSRVLTGSDDVRPELTGRVLDAVRALDYRPNRSARDLRVRSVQRVGVVLDIQNPFFTGVLRGIEEVFQAEGYVVMLGDSNENPEAERAHLEMLRDERVAGAILSICSDSPARYRSMIEDGIPLVLLDRVLDGLDADAVLTNNADAARQATEHLLACGRRRIGLIYGLSHTTTSMERRAGYEQAITRHGLRLDPVLIQPGYFTVQGGYQAMRALLDLPERPTAVFVANNLMTLGAFQAIHECGLSIPGDVAVIGFDEMPWAISLQPPLTVIAQPAHEIGLAAARALLQRIREPQRPPIRVVLENTLIVRGSSGC